MKFAGVILGTAVLLSGILTGCSPAPSGPKFGATDAHYEQSDRILPAEAVEDEAGASLAAETALLAFSQVQAGYDLWWAGLEPLMHPFSAEEYSYLNPANIAAFEITGPGVIAADSTTLVVEVTVPTSVGDYTVTVVRQPGSNAWLAASFIPPVVAE